MLKRFVVLVAATAAIGAADPAFSPGRASFAVRAGETLVPYRVFALFVLPGEEVTLEAESPASGSAFDAEAERGRLTRLGPRRWRWQAPDRSGVVGLRVRRASPADEIRLNVLVMVPASRVRDGWLDGFRIDAYPRTPFRGLDAYRAPRGFIEVTAANVVHVAGRGYRARW